MIIKAVKPGNLYKMSVNDYKQDLHERIKKVIKALLDKSTELIQ